MPEKLPVDSLREAAPLLRRPFTPAAVRWKIQTELGADKGLIVPYIDARLVVERLNAVIPHLWEEDFLQLAPTLLLCKLTVDGKTHRDVGTGKDKALWSDAFKRAAVKFGIGVSIYALPKITLQVGPGTSELRKTQKGKLALKDSNIEKLSKGYQDWLDSTGKEAFGEPLDHGDVVGAQGADDEDAAAGDTPMGPAPLTDNVADLLRSEARALHETANEKGIRVAGLELPGQLEEAMAGAQTHEELESIVKSLRGLT